MMSSAVSNALLILVVGVSILLMLIRPRSIGEFYWIGGGATLLIVLRLVPLRMAGRAVAEGTDVYFFLTGMMLLSELARENGVFDWLACVAMRGARGSCSRLFTLIYAVGTIVTILMSNDATAVVLTPAILTAVRKAKVEPMPGLFACAFVANAASFVLPISNPANLVVFHDGMPSLGRWLCSFGVPSLISTAATFAAMKWIFRRELSRPIETQAETVVLTASGRLVVGGLGVVVAVLLTASALREDLGLPTLLAAAALTAVVSLKTKSGPLRLAREISWETIGLVAGLFILVHAVQSVGALSMTEDWLRWAMKQGPATGALATSFVVGVGSNLVNNLPLGLIAGVTLNAVHARGLIVDAVLIGVDLGPNLSVTGSLATILWLLALRREKLEVSFWRFLKVGAMVMPVALILSICGAILIQILFGG